MNLPAGLVVMCGAALLSDCAAGDPFPKGSCTIASVGDMRVLTQTGAPVIEVRLNGNAEAMIVDSGAGVSSLSSNAADRLQLQQKEGHMILEGVDGSSFAPLATIDHLGVGLGTIHDVPFYVIPGQIEGDVDGLPVAGLFGADFLYAYDAYFDLPDRQFSLYREFHCPADADASAGLGWTRPAYTVPFTSVARDETKIGLPIMLNGHRIDTILDSGASKTLITAEDARAAGVSEADLSRGRRDTISGINGRHREAYHHVFASLAIGPERFDNVELLVSEAGQMSLLGADFLRTHRVVVSYARHLVFIEPSGHAVAPVAPP